MLLLKVFAATVLTLAYLKRQHAYPHDQRVCENALDAL